MLDATNSAAAVRNGSAWMTGQRTAPLELLRRRQPTAYEFSTTGNVTIGQFSADRSNAYGDRGIIGNQYFIIASSSIPTDVERWKLQGWVAHRLLISNDLPYGHPYRQTIPLI